MSGHGEIVDRALAQSKADDCIVLAWQSSTANIRWANNTPTTNGSGDSVGMLVASIIDGRVGIVRRDVIDADGLPDLMRASEAACEGKPKAQDLMPLLPGDGIPDDWNAGSERTEVSSLAPAVKGIADLFARAADEDVLTYGYAEHGTSNTWLGTSTGLRRRETRPSGKIEFTSKADAGARSTWNGRVLTSFDQVDVGAMWEASRERLAWQSNKVALDAGRYEVLLSPSCVADMLLYLYATASRRDADEGRNVFSGKDGSKVGQALFPSGYSVYSDPHEPMLEATPFEISGSSSATASVFDNGMDLEKTYWIRDGVLENLVTTRHWADKAGIKAAPSIGNLVFEGGDDRGMADLIAGTERALLVDCLWYIRAVDPQTLLLTGLTRDGVYLVEDGEVKGAANNFRFNMSPVTMLKNLKEAGASEVTLPREFEFGLTKMPPARVADWHMSSVSAAT